MSLVTVVAEDGTEMVVDYDPCGECPKGTCDGCEFCQFTASFAIRRLPGVSTSDHPAHDFDGPDPFAGYVDTSDPLQRRTTEPVATEDDARTSPVDPT